jgi:hypothetical protein
LQITLRKNDMGERNTFFGALVAWERFPPGCCFRSQIVLSKTRCCLKLKLNCALYAFKSKLSK